MTLNGPVHLKNQEIARNHLHTPFAPSQVILANGPEEKNCIERKRKRARERERSKLGVCWVLFLSNLLVLFLPCLSLGTFTFVPGIPYAASPTSKLRFMPPVTPDSWNGIRSAEKHGPSCPQNLTPLPAQLHRLRTQNSKMTDSDIKAMLSNETLLEQLLPPEASRSVVHLTRLLSNQSEDCLYLNIYTPGQCEPELTHPQPVFTLSFCPSGHTCVTAQCTVLSFLCPVCPLFSHSPLLSPSPSFRPLGRCSFRLFSFSFPLFGIQFTDRSPGNSPTEFKPNSFIPSFSLYP